ncbi:MAG: phosphotriesterase family protein, partial [Daejeonella sp.]
MMSSRRKFIQQGSLAFIGSFLMPFIGRGNAPKGMIMTINGSLKPSELKFTLTHEHVLVDFIGAEKWSKDRYNAEEVFNVALPFLHHLKKSGCLTFVDCTPAFIGRDALLLQRLSTASGLHIITNTGYYGAAGEKFLPKHVYSETAEQISERWINEWKFGIDGTGIKPGFIKTGVDKA